jgi:TolB-like protein
MPPSDIDVPKRRLSAILFADVHGYSALMDRDETGTYQRITQSLRLIRSLIGDYSGQVLNIAGDGVLAVFDTASEAVRFAVELQREFRNDAVWCSERDRIAFRIGINLGEIIVDEQTVHGHSVNIAARLQALAPPGGICLSENVRQALEGRAEIAIRPLGRHRLKNITGPIDVFTVEIDSAKPDTPPWLPPMQSTLLAPPNESSVAVLPLDNMTGDPSDEHLCKGISDDIITNLCRFRDLTVIARHSAFMVKDMQLPIQEIGRQLGIRYVLLGKLQRAGRRIRIAVQLVDSETGSALWADRFDGDLEEIFDFQDEVTEIIAARLALQIQAAERRRMSEAHDPDLRAYGLILRGEDLGLRFRRETNAHARRLFEQAVEVDPKFGRSYAAMSRTFNLDWRYSWSATPELSLGKAVDLAMAAINHDNLDARGYSELGYAYLYQKRHDECLAAYRRAIELNPNDADIVAEYADALVYVGEGEQSIDLMSKAMRLNPYHPDWYLWYLADAYNSLGRSEEVIETVKRMRDPSEGRRLLAANYAHLGMMDEARKHADQVMQLHPHFTVKAWAERPPYRDRTIIERYMTGLRLAGLPEE